jgi:hypothetical protein
MQQQSQRTMARVAAVSPKSTGARMLEAARASSQTATAERARCVEPGLERLLCQMPKNTDSHGRTE